MVGSGIGVGAALFGRETEKSEPAPLLAPAAARPFEAPAERTAPAVASRTMEEKSAPSASSAPPRTLVENDPPITSQTEYEAAALACEGKDASACRRAARACETGEVVAKDLDRAKTLRRVELTILVRKCEKGSVEECLTLADRYLRGD